MRMDEIGWHSIHSADFSNERPNGAGDWVFLLIKSPCIIAADGEMRKFPPYTWILYTPEAYQKYGADSMEYCDDWMHFAPDADEEALLRELNIPLNTPLALPKGTEISKILRTICLEYYSARPHRKEMTDLHFKMLLYRLHEQLLRVQAVPVNDSTAEQLRQIKEFVFRKPFSHFEAASFADELGMTEEAFLSRYQAENASTFPDDLIETKFRYIAEQMKLRRSENHTVEEIAQLCGYADEAEFIGLFTRFIGQSPQSFLDAIKA